MLLEDFLTSLREIVWYDRAKVGVRNMMHLSALFSSFILAQYLERFLLENWQTLRWKPHRYILVDILRFLLYSEKTLFFGRILQSDFTKSRRAMRLDAAVLIWIPPRALSLLYPWDPFREPLLDLTLFSDLRLGSSGRTPIGWEGGTSWVFFKIAPLCRHYVDIMV